MTGSMRSCGFPDAPSGGTAAALMCYGVRDEEGKEKNTETLGIFLPFYHFERMMEKNIELQTVLDWDAGSIS